MTEIGRNRKLIEITVGRTTNKYGRDETKEERPSRVWRNRTKKRKLKLHSKKWDILERTWGYEVTRTNVLEETGRNTGGRRDTQMRKRIPRGRNTKAR